MVSVQAADDKARSGQNATTLESDALASLFPRVAAMTILVVVIFINIRGSGGSKTWDRAAFVASVLGTLLWSVSSLRRSKMMPSRLALVVTVGGVLWGLARIEHYPMTTVLWKGFGLSVAIVSFLLALLIVPLWNGVRKAPALSRVLAGLFVGLATIDVLSLVRDLSDFPGATNNMFVLNEVLAPSAGRVPGANFIPQYTTLMGWIFVPFRHLMSAYALGNLATITLSCFSIAAVALGVVLARRSLPERSFWIAIGLVVPITTVTALHNPNYSSIGSLLQELPVRMFPAMLFSVLAVPTLAALLRHMVRKRLLVSLGFLAALIAWNSQDFGIAVAVSFGLVLLMATRGALRKQATVLWLCGFAPGAILYPVGAAALGHPLRLSYLALTARSFAGGAASAPIQLPGPVLFVLPMILGSVAVGGCLVWRAAEVSSERPEHQQHAVVTLAFVGMWSTVGFVYYLDRSYASGQLQLFLLPVGVCSAALLSLCQTASIKRPTMWLLPVTLAVAVGLGSILQTPSPWTTIDSLSHPAAFNGFRDIVPTREVLTAMAYVRREGGGSVGYIGPNANYLSLSTGVRSRILYDDPADFGLSRSARQLGCVYLRQDPTTWLVVGDPNVGEPDPLIGSELGSRICGAYEPVTTPDLPSETIFRLRPHLARHTTRSQ